MAGGRLARSLGLIDVVLIGLNGVVGAGIFLLPGEVARALGPWSWVAYVACALICLLIALCFAEMGGMHQDTGGAYLYARDAFGPFAGFLVGWVVWVASVLGWASVATGFADLLGHHPSLSGSAWQAVVAGPWGKSLVLVGLLGLLSLLNLLGVRVGATANHFFSIGKLLPLLLFVSWGTAHYTMSPSTAALPASGAFPLEALPGAILTVLFTFSGFEEIPVPAGEVRDPQRVIPRALLIVIGFVTLLYMAIQVVCQAAVPVPGKNPLAEAAGVFMGPRGAWLLGIGAVISLLGVNAAIAFTGPRSMYALAADRFLPVVFARVHPSFRTPWTAIVATSLLALLLPLAEICANALRAGASPQVAPWLPKFDLQTLIKMSALASVLQYIPTCLAVLVMRRRHPQRPRPFRIPGGPLVPLAALVFCLWLVSSSDPADRIWTLGGMALGAPVYLLSARRRSDRPEPTEAT